MDMLTGLIIWAAQAAMISLLMFIGWIRYRSQTFRLSWSVAFALFGAGIVMISQRGQIPSFLSIEVGNAFVLGFIAMLMVGLRQFDGKPLEGYIAIPVLIWIGGLLLSPVRESFSGRVVLYNVSASIGFAMLIAMLVPGRTDGMWPRRVLAVILGIHVLTGLTHAAMTGYAEAMSLAALPSPGLVLVPGAFCFFAAMLTGAQMMAERAEQRLKALASTDPLTGILNRRGLMDEFQSLRNAKAPGKPFIALLHFDIDHFKQVNDLHGHQAGDAVLVAFSRLASISLSPRGAFGRMGGEEFASILRVSDVVEAASIAEGLRMTLALQTIAAGEQRLGITVSAGISLQPAAKADLDHLLSAADRALYAAKTAGRNCTAVEDAGRVAIVPSATMLTKQEMALELSASEQVSALRRLSAAAG